MNIYFFLLVHRKRKVVRVVLFVSPIGDAARCSCQANMADHERSQNPAASWRLPRSLYAMAHRSTDGRHVRRRLPTTHRRSSPAWHHSDLDLCNGSVRIVPRSGADETRESLYPVPVPSALRRVCAHPIVRSASDVCPSNNAALRNNEDATCSSVRVAK